MSRVDQRLTDPQILSIARPAPAGVESGAK